MKKKRILFTIGCILIAPLMPLVHRFPRATLAITCAIFQPTERQVRHALHSAQLLHALKTKRA